ncbi:depupylase/deamidase Dop [Dermatobacter hominis]|uniref:depupylase/deamidase Dop n=1 Tax=Dermatobacter hominis TaxID=2884263 RepID=UPI001D10111C|nr:depupylase/deamidase Dop [Dermatobacter hominis]UDY36393.1 proteasome accessory factor PafA2 [Dermatobacter hominis]
MAIAKICGIETEYGILVRGAGESNPISASSMLINAYLAALEGERGSHRTQRVGWNFDDESPGNDAREETLLLSLAPEVETHLVNAVLTNGARYYVDHAHPEYSCPEAPDALTALTHDRAGEEILIRSMAAATSMLPDDQEIVVYKNNSDGKGNSYGCHENYLVDRAVPFGRIVAHATGHLVTRQIFTGAGKVGSEAPGMRTDEVPFQLTQRADFFEEEVGLETTLKRPIINTRDEPHADAQKYRRLHVITGDANLSEVQTFLKLGTTALVLAMVEDDVLGAPLALARPVPAMHQVSWDLSLAQPLEMADGSRRTALDLQWELFGRARDYAESRGLDALGPEDVGEAVLSRWEAVLSGLDADPMTLSDQLDWVAKYRLYEAYRERDGMEWSDPRLAAMDLQYHDLRPGRCLARKLGLERLTDDDEVRIAMTEPPSGTRAYFRGRCLERFASEIVAANWDSLVFDTGGSSLRRVPMLEPARGTEEHVGELLDAASSASDLLDRLGR